LHFAVQTSPATLNNLSTEADDGIGVKNITLLINL